MDANGMKPSERIEEIIKEIVNDIVRRRGIDARNWHKPEDIDKVNAIIQYLDEVYEGLGKENKPIDIDPGFFVDGKIGE